MSRSPVYSFFGEVLQGLLPIRAFNRSQAFLRHFFTLADEQQRNFLTFWFANRWLAVRLDLISVAMIFAVAVLSVGVSDAGVPINANILGLALVYALQLTALLQWFVRTVAETENNMTSVERLLVFNSIPPEEKLPPAQQSAQQAQQQVQQPAQQPAQQQARQPAKQVEEAEHAAGVARAGVDALDTELEWPSKGAIEIRDLKLRYRPGLDLVVRGLSLSIPGSTKVGVCGR